MNDGWKRISAASLSLVIAVGLFAGCSKDSEGAKEPEGSKAPDTKQSAAPATAAYELGKEPLEFSFYGHYDWYTMPNWGEDLATKWMKDNLKVNVTPVSSGGNAAQKFSTMIVSGSLPDVIWMERGADVEKLRAEGLLVPFDDYLDKYPNMKKWVGESTIDMLRSPDGKIYQFPNWYTTQPNGNAGYLVNKKIYNELGTPPLETTDDLYNYLKQVQAKYPDVVPFEVGEKAEAIDVITSAFAENRPPSFNSLRISPNGDKLTSIFTDAAFREGLQFGSKLFREKLITQDAMTQKREQVEQKIITGKIAVYAASSPTEFGAKGETLLKAEDPNAGYIMVWPIHKAGLDKNKIFPGDYKQLGWNVSVITKSAKNPEAIFAFLDWMTGPQGQRTIMWGPEGLYWDGTDADDAPIFTEKFTTDEKERNLLMDSTVNLQWNGNTVYVDNSKMKFEMTLPVEKRNWETRWQSEITWKTQFNTTEYVNLSPAGDTEEGITDQAVKDIYDKARAKALINAKDDAEVLAILDQADKDAAKVGYEKLLNYQTEIWQKNKANVSK
jgi:ABC-type glycerol-3-phosphate transport system substrate-binding protein